MTTLYFRPGTCSLSPHIALREAGLPFKLQLVDKKTRMTPSGVDFNTRNPKGYVPALELDDGQILTEGAVIVQYIADQSPHARLAPAAGSMERYRLAEWLNYVATELHKGFSPFFRGGLTDDGKKGYRDAMAAKYTYLDGIFAKQPYLMGESFSVADGYLFTILSWSAAAQLEVASYPNLKAYFDRIEARPAVKAALAAEKNPS